MEKTIDKIEEILSSASFLLEQRCKAHWSNKNQNRLRQLKICMEKFEIINTKFRALDPLENFAEYREMQRNYAVILNIITMTDNINVMISNLTFVINNIQTQNANQVVNSDESCRGAQCAP